MGRPLSTNFSSTDVADLSALRPIAVTPESDVMEGINWLHARAWPMIVHQTFQDSVSNPYIEPSSTSYVVNCIWRRRVFADAPSLNLAYYVENGGTQSGTIKAEIASDPSTYVQTDVIASATTANWTSMTLTQDPSQTRDSLVLSTKEDVAGAAMRLHSISVRVPEFSSIPAGKTNEGFLPCDTIDYAANEPLSTWLRRMAFDNLDVIRKTRSDTIVAWSGNWARTGSEYYSETSSSYVLVAEVPFVAGIGQDTIEASVTGFRVGSLGWIKLTTGYMENVLGTSVTQSLATKASSPYTANIHDVSNLTCLPNKADTLRIYLRGDGTNAGVMMGVCAWFADVA